MNEPPYTGVDQFLAKALLPNDTILAEVLKANAAAGLPAIDVSPLQGALLNMIVKLQGARRILEVGTLGGYSAICMARALGEEGKLVTLELNPKHAQVARENISLAGQSSKVEVRVGQALDILAELKSSHTAPFDLVFLDADKVNLLEYFRGALELSRPGTLIIADNVIRKGHILHQDSVDPYVIGVQRFIRSLISETRVEATAVQTVGLKGYDGMIFARVRE
jgi:predicted O-methyltransferase YrrM